MHIRPALRPRGFTTGTAIVAAVSLLTLCLVAPLSKAQTMMEKDDAAMAEDMTGMVQMQGMAQTPGMVMENGKVALPEGFREWVFIGAPLTPNGLNGGAAAFPEFHHVYIEPDAFATYQKTGEFPEGTVIVKELVLLKDAEYPDGSRDEASGRGFFADTFAGIDMMVKDSKRYARTDGWGFFNYGHHAPPYAKAAAPMAADACAACHTANADYDMVFTGFYPVLGKK